MRVRWPGALAALVLAAGCGRPAPPTAAGATALEPLPGPPPAAMIPAARARYEELRRAVSLASGAGAAAAWAELGRTALACELLDAALACFANAARLEPGSPDWPYYQAVVDQLRGDGERAAAGFGRVLALAPDDLAASLRLGEVELQRGRPDAALAAFERARALAPEATAALHGAGRAHAARGDHDTALALLERAGASAPDGSVVHYVLGQALHRAGAHERATEELARAGQVPVGFPDPRMEAVARIAGQLALAAAEELLAAPGADDDAIRSAVTALGRVEDAVPALERALAAAEARVPRDRGHEARLLAAAGALLETRGDALGGLARHRAAVERAPDDPRAWRRLGRSAALAGNLEEALHSCEQAVKLAPGDRAARLDRAGVLIDLGRAGEALRETQELVTSEPGDAGARLQLARALEASGRQRDAVAAWREALTRDLSTADRGLAEFHLGAALLREGRIGEALTAARAATELAPAAAGAWFNLGAALARSGDLAAAIPAYARAATLAPAAEAPRMAHARALLEAGRTAAARAALEAGVRDLPASAALAHQLARVLAAAPEAELRDPERAAAIARRLIEDAATPERVETLAIALAAGGRAGSAADLARRLGREDQGFPSHRRRRERLVRGQPWLAASGTELVVAEGSGR